jgi:uncharacterized protein with NRDE domain
VCLIVFACDVHPRFSLVLGANRDEFYARPTARAHFWEHAPNVLAGLDLEKRGTWMGITLDGRFAAVTNYRQGYRLKSDARSRGLLVSEFLQNPNTPLKYLEGVRMRSAEYDGFNLIAGNQQEVFYYSNRSAEVVRVEPGIHGLSNHLLNAPWPKVERAKTALEHALKEETPATLIDSLLLLLSDAARADDALLPDTGISRDWERVLSSVFITSEDYGTRSSSVLLISRDHEVIFVERSFGPHGSEPNTVRHRFRIREVSAAQTR